MSHVHGLQVLLKEQISDEIQVSLSTIPDYTFFLQLYSKSLK